MEADFRALLLAAVTGIVGTRVFPSTYPQAAASPAVRYAKITGAPGQHMQGTDGLNFDVMQVDARGLSAADMLAVRDAAVSSLNVYVGTQGGTEFQRISLRDDRGVQYETTGAEQFFTTSLDFDVIWRAA